MSSFNLDGSFFQIWVKGKSYTGRPIIYTPETDLDDAPLTKAKLIEFMRDAFDASDVAAVIEFNPVEGWSQAITEEVVEAMEGNPDGDDNREHRIGSFEAGVGAFA